MITKETAHRIWCAHDEIAHAQSLIEELEKAEQGHEQFSLRDSFGRPRGLQLGVPTSSNGHRLYDVAPSLAKCVIQAHKAQKESELMALNEQAMVEAQQKSNI